MAVVSLLVGLLAAAAIPVGILITNYRNDLRLIHAGYAVPVAAVLGFVAVRLARRARRRLERTVGRAGGAVPARLGRIFNKAACVDGYRELLHEMVL